ncbi:MAG TPA: hypothetical protein VIY48_14080 [Candidatus Paceibacterota bacterium]
MVSNGFENELAAFMVLRLFIQRDVAREISDRVNKLFDDSTNDKRTLHEVDGILIETIDKYNKRLEILCPSVDTAM